MSVDFTTTSLKDTVLSHYIFDEFEAEPEINQVAQRCLERLEKATDVPLIVTEQAGPVERLRLVFRSVMSENTAPPTAPQRGNLAEYYPALKTQKNEKLRESRLEFWKDLGGDELDLDGFEELSGDAVEVAFREWLDQHPDLLQKNALRLTKFIPHLPPEIGLFTQLRHLVLENTYVSQLPPEMGNLTQLEGLEIQLHNLRRLPPEIGQLTGLKKLCIYSSGIRTKLTIPSEINQLTQLEFLDLRCNRKIENVEALAGLPGLKYLDLGYNGMTEFPVEACNLPQLKQIKLDGNELTILPRQLENLTELQTLNVRNNRLKALPLQLKNLAELQSCDIRDNDIEEIDPLLLAKLNQIKDFERVGFWKIEGERSKVDRKTEAKIAQAHAVIGLLSMMPSGLINAEAV